MSRRKIADDSAISCFVFTEFLTQIVDDVFKFHRISGIRCDECLVCREDVLLFVSPVDFFGWRLKCCRCIHAVAGVDFEEVVKSEIFEKRRIALVDIDGAEMALTDFPQTQGNSRKRAHEC